MKYTVIIINNGSITEFDSSSRDSLKHLRQNGGKICRVYDKKGQQLSESRYRDDFGWYRISSKHFK